MNILRPAFMLLLFATPAMADKPAYCAAYARDFADARSHEKPMWQHKYDIALQACLGPPAPTIIKVVKPAKPKKVETPIAVDEPLPKPTQLVAGSEDWNTYCANKYTSFNPKTGTYMSKTGVERKCVVSAS
jgi:BA14K-like protein